ncbi:MAG: phosphoenolpyruvate--protein phosphotransferase [Burkholderiales bacterium]|nr:phosphoenolpyruvate--protein phosphotransferase [Burkholderiales bacterium]
MSFILQGTGVSGGIAIGRAHLVSHAHLEVAHYNLPQKMIPFEVARYEAAVASTREELEALRASIPSDAPAEFGAFLSLHLMILGDSTLSQVPRQIIETQHCNAEWAIKQQMGTLLTQFDRIEDAYLRERKADVVQVVERVLKVLLGQKQQPPQSRDQGSILVAHDLSPADVILLKASQCSAFITDLGGTTSHTTIVARSLNIPSIVALHNARRLIRDNDLLIIDGTRGAVIVDPDKAVLAEYKLLQEQWELEKQKLKRIKSTRSATLDGTRVNLHANIELPQDIKQVKESGAAGIGLFRSEFLFLNRVSLPGEEEQFEFYRQVAQEMKGLPVTIRTLDLGADKQLNGTTRVSANPALGLRAIRLCLAEPQMFRTQLRAILRASSYGKLRILIPMLSSASELNQTLVLIGEAKRSLEAANIPYDREIEVGGMIEIPAAALALPVFMQKLDFLSIGTNDLIQYTLAIDRADDSVAHLYDPLHPAVLHLVSHVIRSANLAGVPVAVCGEMAGDAELTRMLLGFGLREFSMHPSNLLTVKRQVLKSNITDIAAITQKMLKTDEPEKIRALLNRLNA